MNFTQHITTATYERVQSPYINEPVCTHTCGTERRHSFPRPHPRPEVNVELVIHTMETEAYASVLKALVAQSDLLSWEKEGLITMLRKELNVTDVEHGELLVKINSDQSIKMIRERRKGTLFGERIFCAQMNNSSTALGLPGDISYKRLKGTPAAAAPRFIKYTLHGQPSSAATSSHFPAQFMDGQQRDQSVIISPGASKEPVKVVCRDSQAPSINKAGRPQKSQLKKGCDVSAVVNVNKPSNVIEIRATDKLIQEVERVMYDTKSPDLAQVEKAKLLLKEHERAICGALAKIAAVLDADQLQQHYYHRDLPGTGRGSTSYNNSIRQPCQPNDVPGQGFVQIHSEGRRSRYIGID